MSTSTGTWGHCNQCSLPLRPFPEVKALSQHIAPLTRTRLQTPYDSLGLWLAVVPKRRSVLCNIPSRLASLGHHDTSIHGSHLMTSRS